MANEWKVGERCFIAARVMQRFGDGSCRIRTDHGRQLLAIETYELFRALPTLTAQSTQEFEVLSHDLNLLKAENQQQREIIERMCEIVFTLADMVKDQANAEQV